MIKQIRIAFFALPIFIGLSNIAFAQQDWLAEVNALLDVEKYDEAYEIISNPNIKENSDAYIIKGTLLGFGLLTTGTDICAAVINFEKVPMSEYSLRWTLDYLYNGEWARIAANEGNPQALFIVGERFLKMSKRSTLIFSYDKQAAIKSAYRFFYNSAELGNKKAMIKLTELEAEFTDIDFSKYQTTMQFKPSLCPVREVAR